LIDRSLYSKNSSIIAKSIASLLGIGYIPFAPGTMASLFAIIFISLIKPSLIVLLFVVFITLIIGTWASQRCEYYWDKDNKKIVIDEFAGQAIALISIPINLNNLLVAFILFRFFDIVKPPPIRNIEKYLKGGLAVILDDVVAGIFANIFLQIYLYNWSN